MLKMYGEDLNGLPYEGDLKPCRFCGSEDVQYLTLGPWKRLACFSCDRWLEEETHIIEEVEMEEEEVTEEQLMFEMAIMLFELIDRAHCIELKSEHYEQFKERLKLAAMSLNELGFERLQEQGLYLMH